MAKQPKRRLAFRTEHQGNPLSHARLTKSDKWNGVIFVVELDGKIRELSLSCDDVGFALWLARPHIGFDTQNKVAQPGWDGTMRLPFAVPTFRDFEHYRTYMRREKEVAGTFLGSDKITDEGDLKTDHHRYLIELLGYAVLPLWAKDEAAFMKRWGHTAKDHTFRAMFAPTARHEQVVRAEQMKLQQRRAA